MVDTRGSWTLDQAICRRWQTRGLNNAFRAFQSDPLAGEYEVLNDEEARPSPPGPYCVYSKAIPIVLGHHTGKQASTENQLLSILTTFAIHAKSTSQLSGKEIAVQLATQVAAAFDPENDKLDISPDSHVNTIRMGDWPIREDDDEWVWHLVYDFRIDAEYDAPSP